jgi:hypothetical protein
MDRRKKAEEDMGISEKTEDEISRRKEAEE